MNHAAAQQLDPAGAATNAAVLTLAAEWAANSELKTRLGKWEVERLGLYVHLLAVIFRKKRLQYRNQVTGMDALADVDSLELIKSMVMPSINILVAETTARHHEGNGLAFFE